MLNQGMFLSMKTTASYGLRLGVVPTLLLATSTPAWLFAASAYSDQFIGAELERARLNPDNTTTLEVAQPIDLVFDALLTRLAEYSEDIAGVSFDHDNALVAGELGIGSLRITHMDDGTRLVQKIIVFDPPRAFAYFTDMSLSSVSAPIDYSIGYYRFEEQAIDRISATVSVTYQPSSRLTAFLVRLGFGRALSRDFRRAEDYLNSLPWQDSTQRI